MSDFKGFFDLQTPADLLAKLRHDYERLRLAPVDSYAAFDFFVTGLHMLDWVYPSDPGSKNYVEKKRLEKEQKLLRVCSHAGNEAKHFEVTRHDSIVGANQQEGGFQGDAFQSDGFQVDSLVFVLNSNEAKEFNTAQLECLSLAAQVLQFWENHLRV